MWIELIHEEYSETEYEVYYAGNFTGGIPRKGEEIGVDDHLYTVSRVQWWPNTDPNTEGGVILYVKGDEIY